MGAALAELALRDAPSRAERRLFLATAVIASNFPDLDLLYTGVTPEPLGYLLHHRGRVVSQGELTEHIYAQGFDRDSNTVEVFVARLRRKVGTTLIATVRGLGYRMDCEGAGK